MLDIIYHYPPLMSNQIGVEGFYTILFFRSIDVHNMPMETKYLTFGACAMAQT